MQAPEVRAESRVGRGSSPMLARQHARAVMLVDTAPAAIAAWAAMLMVTTHPIGSTARHVRMVLSRTTAGVGASSAERGRPAPMEHARSVTRGHHHPKTDRPAVTAPTTKPASVEPVKCVRLGRSPTLTTLPVQTARRVAPVSAGRVPRVLQGNSRPTASSAKPAWYPESCRRRQASAMHARQDKGQMTTPRTV